MHSDDIIEASSVHFASFPLCPRTFLTIVVYSRRLISPSNTFFFNATFTFFRQTRHTITISTISSARTRYTPLMALAAWDTQYKLESSHLWFNEVEESFKHVWIRRSIIINNRREFSRILRLTWPCFFRLTRRGELTYALSARFMRESREALRVLWILNGRVYRRFYVLFVPPRTASRWQMYVSNDFNTQVSKKTLRENHDKSHE